MEAVEKRFVAGLEQCLADLHDPRVQGRCDHLRLPEVLPENHRDHRHPAGQNQRADPRFAGSCRLAIKLTRKEDTRECPPRSDDRKRGTPRTRLLSWSSEGDSPHPQNLQ